MRLNGFGSHISLLRLCSNRNSDKSQFVIVDVDVVFPPDEKQCVRLDILDGTNKHRSVGYTIPFSFLQFDYLNDLQSM